MTEDLNRLRAAAKRLRRDHARGEADALARIRAVHGARRDLRHADFLHVIAREAGHASWPRLKFAHETAAMDRVAKAERLKIALYFGQHWVTGQLIADTPDLASGDLGLQIATYDRAAVAAALAADPGAATRAIGTRRPILHLAFSREIHRRPEARADMLAIARLLLSHGADPNDGYPPEPGSDHRLSALYGALGHADNLPLAEWLLDHGATPNDDESLYHATELGHRDGLRLLLKHGADPAGTNALARALDFDDREAVTLLLDHGADPDEAAPEHPSGQALDVVPALHQAARRWCSAPVVETLLDHGADPRRVWRGVTPYSCARIYGNCAAARVLAARGHAHPLPEAEAILARAAEGRPPGARIEIAALPEEARHLPTRVAGRPDRLDHLRALILAGFDPEGRDEMDMTPLHIAGWEGLPDHVAFLLTLAPDLALRNAYGGDALGTVIHGAEFSPHRSGRDHVACARLLLGAGAPLRRREIDETGSEEMAAFLEDWAADNPGQVI